MICRLFNATLFCTLCFVFSNSSPVSLTANRIRKEFS
jgi:hypothetical protein